MEKKITQVRDGRKTEQIMLRVSAELKADLAVIGKGRPGMGLHQILSIFREEIGKAAQEAKKAS